MGSDWVFRNDAEAADVTLAAGEWAVREPKPETPEPAGPGEPAGSEGDAGQAADG